DLPPQVTLLQGANAQGKTNLLEAITLLSTARSPRTPSDREWLSWHAEREPLPYARLEASLTREQAGEEVHLEMVLAPTGNATANGPAFRKQVRVNGTPCKALDFVGILKVVLFMPEDVDLVAGAPAGRRRYLDIALCQMDNRYCHALSRYLKVLERRNALLRHLREAGGDPAQLAFWDRELVQAGSYVLALRQAFVASLDAEARRVHWNLAGPEGNLHLQYLSSVPLPLEQGETPSPLGGRSLQMQEQVAQAFWQALRESRERERAAGVTLAGPHRDDLQFLLGGRDLRTYGSRGQQRTAALAVKIAEVAVMREQTGESPVLLLDDVMSELDQARRRYLLQVLDGASQAIVTTTDWGDFTPEFRARAHCLQVEGGQVRPVPAP
ncbi:MAG: DNA replication/repair protein RecF, partial [Anaerolineae bacterium]